MGFLYFFSVFSLLIEFSKHAEGTHLENRPVENVSDFLPNFSRFIKKYLKGENNILFIVVVSTTYIVDSAMYL